MHIIAIVWRNSCKFRNNHYGTLNEELRSSCQIKYLNNWQSNNSVYWLRLKVVIQPLNSYAPRNNRKYITTYIKKKVYNNTVDMPIFIAIKTITKIKNIRNRFWINKWFNSNKIQLWKYLKKRVNL